jgi:hypothetical protein
MLGCFSCGVRKTPQQLPLTSAIPREFIKFGDNRMVRKNRFTVFMSLVPVLLILTACSGSAEPTTAPTVEPTDESQAVQIKILPSEVVVEKILVGEPDADTGEMEVVVKGYVSNTCTTVDGVTVSRDGDVFTLNVETAVSTGEACEGEAVPFEETVSVNTLSPSLRLANRPKSPVKRHLPVRMRAKVLPRRMKPQEKKLLKRAPLRTKLALKRGRPQQNHGTVKI